jgi:hypothetical protein
MANRRVVSSRHSLVAVTNVQTRYGVFLQQINVQTRRGASLQQICDDAYTTK